MKAKTQRIVSLVLAAAMTLTSLTFVNAADSVNADLAGEFKVTINAPLDKSAADTYHFSNDQIAIQAERAINDKGNQSDPQIEELPVGENKTQKIRPYYRVTTKVAGSLSIEHEDIGTSTGKHIVVIKVEDPKGPGSIDASPLTETYSLVQDFKMVTGTTVETTDPVDPGVYVIGTSGGNYAIKSIAISGDAVTAGTGEAGTAKQPTEPSKEIVPSESPYYTGDTYQVLDTYNAGDTVPNTLLHTENFELNCVTGGAIYKDHGTPVAIQANNPGTTFGSNIRKNYKIHALKAGKLTIGYTPIKAAAVAIGEAATGDDSAAVEAIWTETPTEIDKPATKEIEVKEGYYYYFGGNGTTPYLVSVKYEGNGGSVTPPPVTTSGTINFTAVVNDEDKTVESDGIFTVDIFVEASEATPVNNADFIFNFNKDVAKVVSAKRLADGAELGAEPTEVLDNYLIEQAGHVDNESSPFWGKSDLVGSQMYESGIVPLAFFLKEGTEITTTRQKVATLELQAIAEGTVDPVIVVTECMSAPNGDEAQKNWKDDTANPDVTVDAPAIDNVTVTESQVTPPTDKNSLAIDPQESGINSADPKPVTVKIVLNTINDDTAVNNGTFWIFYNGEATKNGAPAGKGTDYVIADSLNVVNLTGTAVDSPVDLTWKIGDANINVNGEEYVDDDKDHTPAEVGKLKAAFRIQKGDQIDANDLIPDVGVNNIGIAEVVFKLKDGLNLGLTENDEIRIPVTLKTVDFAGVPTYENGVLSYPDIDTDNGVGGYIVITGKESSQPTTESSTSTTEAPKPDDSTTSTTEAPKPDDSTSTTEAPQPDDSTTTTQAQQPTNPPATEGHSEATTSRPSSSGGSSGGGGGGGGSAHRSTTTVATTEAVTEAASSGEVDTAETPDEEKPAGAVAEFLNAEGYHFAYMVGYPDGSFGPNRNVTRGEIAAVFARLITGDINVGSNSASYSDIAGNEWYADYIGYLEDLDIIAGYTDGTFGPNRPITRAEFAALLSKFTGSASASDATFTDVAGHWAAAQIAAAVKAGWMSGYPDKTFKPNAYITRAELVSAINRATGRTPDVTAASGVTFTDVPNGAWYANDVAEAVTEHWYTGKEKWYLSEDEYNAAVAPSEEEVSEETTEAASEAVSGETTTAEEESTTEGETSDGTTEAVTEAAAESTTKEDSTEPSA